MPSLTIRDIPEPVMEQLRRAAKEEKRSVNAQAIQWFEEAAGQRARGEGMSKIVDEIIATSKELYRRHGMGSDSTKLIRQMRDARGKHLR